MKITRVLSVVFSVLLCAPAGFGEEKSCPHHAEHQKQVNERGDHVMGFDHRKTVHHFELKPDGGVIRAEAKDAADSQSIDGIRKHFVEISALFAKGDFSMPMAIHDRVPPGVAGMKTHQKDITYSAVEIPNGGEVRIKTEKAEALKAIHEFLRFQIEDHQTGDPLTISH
jgi:hypothetical protein